MFYVAKLYKSSTPLIVEQFDKPEDAFEYAAIMNRAGKGNYVVLHEHLPE